MENLIAVFSTIKKGVTRYGWAWTKKESDAINNCIKKMEGGETLIHVWVAKWRDAPSKYTLVKGYPSASNTAPDIDFADNIRKQFLKKPKQNRWEKKPHIRLVTPPPKEEPSTPPYRMFLTYEAKA